MISLTVRSSWHVPSVVHQHHGQNWIRETLEHEAGWLLTTWEEEEYEEDKEDKFDCPCNVSLEGSTGLGRNICLISGIVKLISNFQLVPPYHQYTPHRTNTRYISPAQRSQCCTRGSSQTSLFRFLRGQFFKVSDVLAPLTLDQDLPVPDSAVAGGALRQVEPCSCVG